ncbi:hypothetical protein GWI33_014444 [Rhynchophorus ferrugineus]|uniref:Uncharacterized protein n=1 Tax=Rhynchophorus ferrugineus TaxID=354439 RepID=A0A834I533_RHYFE|nr:hypothetical protein GWI33_014444 [Rhynchophorus ferrugineus]
MLSVVSAGAAAGMGGMDRLRGGGRGASQELAASRERQLRLHNLRTDQTLNLPPSISLPDGEEYRATYASSTAATLQLRDAEQESEIYQKCIRAPPNRTVMESESPPPYRSSSTVILPSCSSSSGNSDWSSSGSGFVRSHSMSSTSSSGRFSEDIQRQEDDDGDVVLHVRDDALRHSPHDAAPSPPPPPAATAAPPPPAAAAAATKKRHRPRLPAARLTFAPHLDLKFPSRI